MRNIRGHLIAWTICIAFALIAGEIAGAVIFYRQQGGRLVYANGARTKPAMTSAEPPPIGQRLHPYLGLAATIRRSRDRS